MRDLSARTVTNEPQSNFLGLKGFYTQGIPPRSVANAKDPPKWPVLIRGADAGASRSVVGASQRWRCCAHRTARAPSIRAALLPRSGLSLDAWLLGLRTGWILLGAGNLGDGSRGWFSLDAWLLGMGGRRVPLACRILGTARRLLRRN